MKKAFWIGGRQYILPFTSNHCWVEDAKGVNVCEAYSLAVANAIVKMLNEEAKRSEENSNVHRASL